MSLPVAILAGGLATRLYPLTRTIPKSLVDVAGRPFVVHQLESLRKQGFRRVVLCVGKYGEMIQSAVGDGSRWGMEIEYAFDGPQLLGTGGAIRNAAGRLGDAFLVMYGDSYLRCDFAAVERAFLDGGLPGLMTVFRNDGRFDASNVLFQNGRIVCYDKKRPLPEMRHVDYGLGALRRETLSAYPDHAAFDLADVYRDLAAAGRLAAFETTDRFFEIGSPAGLDETKQFLCGAGVSPAFLAAGETPAPQKLNQVIHPMSYSSQHLKEAVQIISGIDPEVLEKMAQALADLRAGGGRLFFLGVGGSAANCSHAVNDFRKLCGIEAYTPTDNVSELTARTNDDGWDSALVEWLRGSRLTAKDMVFVFSVGGGNREKNVSVGLIRAMDYAKQQGAGILGVVGRDGGYTAKIADVCVIIPTVNPANVTPHAEAMQAVVWHLLVSHPAVKLNPTKW